MKREKVTKNDLDAAARMLLWSAMPNDVEIESIVSKRGIYEGVVARIAVLDQERATRIGIAWKVLTVGVPVLILFSIPLTAFLRYSGPEIVSKPRTVPPVYTVIEDPKPFQTLPQTDPEEIAEPRPVRAVITRSVSRPERPKGEPRPRTAKPPVEAAFYPIGLAANAEDAAIDGRVVRVEMPRSALYALGLDLPLENGTRAIKADLLVGADGTPRAIRMVE